MSNFWPKQVGNFVNILFFIKIVVSIHRMKVFVYYFLWDLNTRILKNSAGKQTKACVIIMRHEKLYDF